MVILTLYSVSTEGNHYRYQDQVVNKYLSLKLLQHSCNPDSRMVISLKFFLTTHTVSNLENLIEMSIFWLNNLLFHQYFVIKKMVIIKQKHSEFIMYLIIFV